MNSIKGKIKTDRIFAIRPSQSRRLQQLTTPLVPTSCKPIFTFGPKLTPGDGIVPVSSSGSSRAFPNVKAASAHGKNSVGHPNVCETGAYNQTTGYEHQNAYNDPDGRTLYATLYSIVRLSAHVEI